MYKKDLVLNNLQWLICHKTKPNETKSNQFMSECFVLLYLARWSHFHSYSVYFVVVALNGQQRCQISNKNGRAKVGNIEQNFTSSFRVGSADPHLVNSCTLKVTGKLHWFNKIWFVTLDDKWHIFIDRSSYCHQKLVFYQCKYCHTFFVELKYYYYTRVSLVYSQP